VVLFENSGAPKLRVQCCQGTTLKKALTRSQGLETGTYPYQRGGSADKVDSQWHATNVEISNVQKSEFVGKQVQTASSIQRSS